MIHVIATDHTHLDRFVSQSAAVPIQRDQIDTVIFGNLGNVNSLGSVAAGTGRFRETSHNGMRVSPQLHNDEVNVAIRDKEISARLTKDFRHDLKSCEQVTMDTWKRRPLLEKVVEPIAWILERQQ